MWRIYLYQPIYHLLSTQIITEYYIYGLPYSNWITIPWYGTTSLHHLEKISLTFIFMFPALPTEPLSTRRSVSSARPKLTAVLWLLIRGRCYGVHLCARVWWVHIWFWRCLHHERFSVGSAVLARSALLNYINRKHSQRPRQWPKQGKRTQSIQNDDGP